VDFCPFRGPDAPFTLQSCYYEDAIPLRRWRTARGAVAQGPIKARVYSCRANCNQLGFQPLRLFLLELKDSCQRLKPNCLELSTAQLEAESRQALVLRLLGCKTMPRYEADPPTIRGSSDLIGD